MEKNSKGSILTPILLSAALVLGVVIGLFAGRNSVDRRLRNLAGELDSPGGKISYALSLIDRYYVDPVSTDSLVEALMPDLMWYLDPHSVYIPASELAEVNMPLEGEFDGIGITFNMSTDTIIVLNVIRQRQMCIRDRRPDNPHRRLARGRTETSDGRRDEDAARTARYAGNGIRPAQGNR